MHEFWLDTITALALALVTYGSTNLDNLLLMVTIAAGMHDRKPAVVGFLVATLVLASVAASFVVFSYVIAPAMLRYLGIVPILLGTRMLFSRSAGDPSASSRRQTPQAIASVLLANSADTIAAFGPLVAESEPVAAGALLVGFVVAAAIWLLLMLKLSRSPGGETALTTKMQRFTPFVMIAVGLYILADTGTDLQ